MVAGLGTSAQKTVEKLGYENNGLVSYVWDGNGNLTTNYWDGFGRLGTVRYPMPSSAGSSNPNDYVSYAFDADNNVVSKRQRDGTYLNMGYDAGNHMTTGGDGATYSYDNFGQLRTASYGGRNLTFGYDALGRVTSQTSNLGTLSYSYDAAGNRTGMVWPDAFPITFNYNANSTLQGFVESSGAPGYVPVAFDYNGQNQLDGIGRSDGVWTGFGFDGVARLNLVQQVFPTSNTADNTNITINFNEASQALSVANSNGLYDWPAPANFSNSYGLNGLNQVTSSNSYTFTYDAKGNLTSDGVNSYAYDVLNRLIHGPNGVSFSYDALGRLASTTNSSGVTTQYLYDGQNLVATYDGSGNLQNRYVFGPGTDQPVLWYSGTGTSARRFLLPNGQGSIIGVADINGNLLAANTYDEYGVPGSNNQGAFQYTGQLWQPDSGLYYYKARIYSPALGRFLQADPIGYGDGPNWYNYANGDPVNGSDPTGTDDVPDGGDGEGGGLSGGFLGATTTLPPVTVNLPCPTGWSCYTSYGLIPYLQLGSPNATPPGINPYLSTLSMVTVTAKKLPGNGKGQPGNAKLAACLQAAFQNNIVSIGLDSAGLLVSALTAPESLAAGGVGLALGAASLVNSATQGDITAIGIGTVGFHLSALTPAAATSGGAVLSRFIPGLGLLVSGVGLAHDAQGFIAATNACYANSQ